MGLGVSSTRRWVEGGGAWLAGVGAGCIAPRTSLQRRRAWRRLPPPPCMPSRARTAPPVANAPHAVSSHASAGRNTRPPRATGSSPAARRRSPRARAAARAAVHARPASSRRSACGRQPMTFALPVFASSAALRRCAAAAAAAR
eukprot:5927439-Prymnesium_polylepis.1